VLLSVRVCCALVEPYAVRRVRRALGSGSGHSADPADNAAAPAYVDPTGGLPPSAWGAALAACAAGLGVALTALDATAQVQRGGKIVKLSMRELYEKIAADPRHGGEITLQQGFAEGRQFSDWSMGFRDLDSPEARSDPGYSEFLNAPLTGREFSGKPSRAQKLLITFKRTM